MLQDLDLATLALAGTCDVSLTVTDACGASNTPCIGQVSVLNDPPVIDINGVSGPMIDNGSLSITCLPAVLDASASSDPEGGALTFSWVTFGGVCSFDATDIPAPTLDGTAAGCSVGLLVTDECGAETSVLFTLTETNTLPVCNAGGSYDAASQGATTAVQLDGTGSSDAEGAVTYLWSIGDCAGASFDDATLAQPTITIDTSTTPVVCNVTLSVTDECGQDTKPCTAQVSISEQNPTCDAGGPYSEECEGATTTVALDGSDSLPPGGTGTLTYAWTTDCPGGTFNDATNVTPVLTLDSGGIDASCNVDLVVTASGGGSSNCSAAVSVVDTTEPLITCPIDQVRGTNDGCMWAPPNGSGGSFLDEGLAVTDNCTAEVDLVVTNDAPTAFPVGTTIVNWTATDAAGNSDTCQQTVKVMDTTPPTIQCPPDLARPANSSCVYAPPDAGGASLLGSGLVVGDNCSDATDITVTNNAPANIPLGTTLVTWTATDEAGNSATCVQSVVVADETAPTLVCPPDISRAPNDGVTWIPGTGDLGAPSAGDNCTAAGSIVLTNDAPLAFPSGVTIVTWLATDAAGNMATCTQQVAVDDVLPPEITCPAPITVEPNANCTYVGDFGQPTVVETVGVTVTNDAPGAFPIGDTVVTWTATDSVGNSASCESVVTVIDTVAPTITCPAVINAACTAADGGAVQFAPTVFDVCDSAPTVVCSPPSGSLFPRGITDVTCTATDASGNSAVCVFSVSVPAQCDGFQVPGDCNGDGAVDISDGVCLINFLFLGLLPELPCGDGSSQDPANQALISWLAPGDIDLSDVIALLNWKFLGGPPHHLGSACLPIAGCPSACGL